MAGLYVSLMLPFTFTDSSGIASRNAREGVVVGTYTQQPARNGGINSESPANRSNVVRPPGDTSVWLPLRKTRHVVSVNPTGVYYQDIKIRSNRTGGWLIGVYFLC